MRVKEILKIVLKNDGFSLVQMVMVAGLFGVASVGMMELVKFQSKSQKSIDTRAQLMMRSMYLNQLISNGRLCRCNLAPQHQIPDPGTRYTFDTNNIQPINLAAGISRWNDTCDNAGTSIISIGDELSGGGSISSLRIVDIAEFKANAYRGNIEVVMERDSKISSGGKFISEKIPIQFFTTVAGSVHTIENCTESGTDSESELPAGLVGAFAMNNCPDGWTKADGSTKEIADYGNLFGAIGTTYGGNGTTNFNLPDYQGYFLRGHDTSGRDPGPRTPGMVLGSTQTSANLQHAHSHYDAHFVISSDNRSAGSARFKPLISGTWRNTGNSGGSESRPINISVLYCIKE